MKADVSTSGQVVEPAEVKPTEPPTDPARPPGWYELSDRVNTRGYWDGLRWTGDFAPTDPPPADAPPAAAPRSEPRAKNGRTLCLVGLVALAVGSLGPWVTAVFVSVDGVQGDGKLTLAAAGLGALFLLRGRGNGILTGLCALAGLGVAIYDLVHVSDKVHNVTFAGTQIAQVGWGLYLCTGGGLIASIGAAMYYRGRMRATPQPTAIAQ